MKTLMNLLGGVIFPIFEDRVIAHIGFARTFRYTALFIGVLLTISCALVTARLPRKKWNYDLRWVDFSLFKDKLFALYTLGAYLVVYISPIRVRFSDLIYL